MPEDSRDQRRRRPVRISCDASYRDGHAGIAAVLDGRDARVLFIDVAKVRSSVEGERKAIEKAMTIARRAGWRRAIFRTDCDGLKVKAKLLPEWRIEAIPRKHNTAAHVASREALKLWEAGVAGQPTVGVPVAS